MKALTLSLLLLAACGGTKAPGVSAPHSEPPPAPPKVHSMQGIADELVRNLARIRELGKFAQAAKPNCTIFPVLAEPNKAPPPGVTFVTARSGEAVVTLVVDCTTRPARGDPRSK